MTNKPPRQQPKLFNAQNATGTLLLMSGSLALGLTAFWATPGKAAATAGAAQSTAQNEVFASAPAATQTDDGGWSDHEYNDDGEYDDDHYRAAPQQDWRGSGSVQPGFSQQPMSAPRGFTRGS